jgi:hypothetical protein
LNLKCDFLVSNFAFKCVNLYRYTPPPPPRPTPPLPDPAAVAVAARAARADEKSVARVRRANDARHDGADADVLSSRAKEVASPSVSGSDGGSATKSKLHGSATLNRQSRGSLGSLPPDISDAFRRLKLDVEVSSGQNQPRFSSVSTLPDTPPSEEQQQQQVEEEEEEEGRRGRNSNSSTSISAASAASAAAASPNLIGRQRGFPGPVILTLELGIGAAGKKQGTLRFREGDTVPAVAAKFVDTHRLPRSALPDVTAVLEESLRLYLKKDPGAV